MSTQTDTAMDLIPTLRAALVTLDDAIDTHDETTEAHARVFTEADVSGAADSVRIVLGQILDSIAHL
jgi:hypothetical protein